MSQMDAVTAAGVAMTPPATQDQNAEVNAILTEAQPHGPEEQLRGARSSTTAPAPDCIRENLARIKQDTFHFGSNRIVVSVYPTQEETDKRTPDAIDGNRRTYLVERGVEMCVAVKNMTCRDVVILPFYVEPDGTEQQWEEETRESTVPNLGLKAVKFPCEIEGNEVQNHVRIRDQAGRVIVDVLLVCDR